MRNFQLVVILLALQSSEWLLAQSVVAQQPFYERMQSLEASLLQTDYDASHIPVSKYRDAVKLKVGFVLINIVEVNDETDQMELNGWLDLRWTDSRLAWDKSNGINRTLVPAQAVWLPDLTLYNSVGSIFPLEGVKHRVSLLHTGQIDMWTPAKYRVFCNFGQQTNERECSLDIGSWTYNGFLLDFDLLPNRNEIKLDHYKESRHYEIVSTTAQRLQKQYDCCPEFYSSVKFTIKFKPKMEENENEDK